MKLVRFILSLTEERFTCVAISTYVSARWIIFDVR